MATLGGEATMNGAKKKTRAERRPATEPTKRPFRKLLDSPFFKMALSVWAYAMTIEQSDPGQAMAKKKEALGWALLAAKAKAEEALERGSGLADCLLEAAEAILEMSHEEG